MSRSRNFSFSEYKEHRQKILFVFLCLVLIYIFYVLLSTYLFQAVYVRSSAMEPEISSGDALVFSPAAKKALLNGNETEDDLKKKRGSIVLIEPLYEEEYPWYVDFANSIVSFLTLQRIDLTVYWDKIGTTASIRRVLAFPGEEVYMKDFILYVKPVGSEFFLTEFELSDIDYNPLIEPRPENWGDSLPWSGNLDAMVLGEDQYFVLCDNRTSGTDSRFTGPVTRERIKGGALFRYWPLGKFSGV